MKVNFKIFGNLELNAYICAVITDKTEVISDVTNLNYITIMQNFKINGKLGEFEISLPENLSEISNEYLKECTNFIHPAPNYALVGIVYKDSLNLVLTSAKKNQPANVAVIPVFIKAGETDSEFIKSLKIGDKVVIAASDLSIGNHINSPYNKITPNNIINLCDGDRNITKEAMLSNSVVCFLDFKLVPVSAIHSYLETTPNKFINPFIRKVTSNVGEA